MFRITSEGLKAELLISRFSIGVAFIMKAGEHTNHILSSLMRKYSEYGNRLIFKALIFYTVFR